jgi:hypothetical protein
MTVIRTDLIPNLYANPIVSVSTANVAVVTVPVIERVVSATGTIGTVTGSGNATVPWTATISLMTTTVGLQTGDIITATAGSGDFAAGGEVRVKAIVGNKSISINKVGGTIPTAGTVTGISLPALSTLPTFITDGDAILFTNPGNRLTFTSSTKPFVAGENISQVTSNATGVVTNVFSTAIDYTVVSGVFNTSNVVTGATSGATTTPTAVTGMNQLLTAGINSTNEFFYKNVDATSFELYTDANLTVGANSSAFTTATTNAGQYTVFDTVLITTP